MTKYAILIKDQTLDLIQVLNGGVRPEIEEQPTCFIFETDGANDTQNHSIQPTLEVFGEEPEPFQFIVME